MNLKDLKINREATLFLDRDGVINKRLVGDYVKKWDDFEFLPGVLDAFVTFSSFFDKIFIVTNQQGIGKGLMTESDLQKIHQQMIFEIEKVGGRIDGIYFCPDLKESHSFMRKPNIGMALKAKKDFPKINFKNSVMVGDSASDMLFGKRVKMTTILISDNVLVSRQYPLLVDLLFPDLKAFSESINFRSTI